MQTGSYGNLFYKEAKMLHLDQLEEGNFYYVLEHNDEPENRFVWYKRDGRLKNPRCCSDTLNTSEQYHYRPLTLDKVDEFDEWMEKHGDCIGRITWTAYKMRLREAKMAKKNDAEKRKEINLYDPKFVHFEWDESLKGKKGFYNDDIGCLKEEIRDEGTRMMGTLVDYCEESTPFLVQSPNNCPPSAWKFFYYDPHYEVKWAYFREGKEIQYRDGAGQWTDIAPGRRLDYFDDDYEYSIKPEEDPRPNVEVNVDVKVNDASSDNKIKITINGKECVFENAEQARMVLQGN